MSTHHPASPEFYLDQALAAFEQARDLVDPDESPGLYGVVLHDIARVYETTGRAGEALDLYRRAAASKRLGSSPADLEITLSTLAASLIEHAEFTEAREVLAEVSELLTRSGMDVGPAVRARRAFDLGLLYERLGDFGEEGTHLRALETFEWALSLLDEHADPGSCATVLRAIARMQLVLQQEHDAAESLTEAIRQLVRDGDRAGQATVYVDLGRVYECLAEGAHTAAPVPAPRPPQPGPAATPAEVDAPTDDDARPRWVAGSDGVVAAGAS